MAAPRAGRFFEGRMGLPLELEKETGKLFPATHRARDVRDGLVRIASEAGVEIRFDTLVTEVLPCGAGSDSKPADVGRGGHAADGRRWLVRCRTADAAHGARAPARVGDGSTDIDQPARAVILASGGLSVAATGSDGIGLRIARHLGHTVHETYPALTPLTAEPPVHAHLAGVSLPVTLTAPLERGSLVARGGFLFTHRGYSGPSVLDVSHVAVQAKQRARGDGSVIVRGGAHGAPPPIDQPILVQWTEHDGETLDALLSQKGAGTVGALVRALLPQRLLDTLLEEAGVVPDTPLAQLRREARVQLVSTLARYPLPWTGDEGYKKAEVTGGGVALGEVDPRTLESRRHPGLHLCGEMLDAFGPIGGYNFAWAFATGRLAGLGAAGLPI